MQDIEELCERVVIIDHGRVFFDGALQDIIDRLATHKMMTLVRRKGFAGADLSAYGEVLERNGLLTDPAFHTALQAVLEVLPVSKNFTKVDVPKNAEGASSDFEALESLRKLAFTEHVQQPEQLKLALAPPTLITAIPEAPATLL